LTHPPLWLFTANDEDLIAIFVAAIFEREARVIEGAGTDNNTSCFFNRGICSSLLYLA